MAIRHGHGKIVTDGLVFAYDTGDKVNSYKGKPTTNLATAIQSRGGDVIADPIDLPPLPKHIAPAVYCSSKVVESTTSWQSLFQYNTAISVANGERFIVTAWVYVPEGKTNNRFNINCSVNGSNTGIIQSPYHDLPTGRWVKVLGSYTNNTGAAVSVTSTRIETHTAAEWTGNITCWAANFMIEKGSDLPSAFRGSPATALGSTRSATEGLLDLTNSRSVELSSISFDDSAELVFDGTDDFITSTEQLQATDSFTIEQVVRGMMNEQNSTQNIYGFGWDGRISFRHATGGYSAKTGVLIYNDEGNQSYSVETGDNHLDGNYHHMVATVDGSQTPHPVKVYIDGELVKESTVAAKFGGSRRLVIGAWVDGYGYFNGDIPVGKVYSKVLTEEEVKNNYTHYSGRFGINKAKLLTEYGGWTRFWWYEGMGWPENETETLGHEFGTFNQSHPYGFQRLPSWLTKDNTELLAKDGDGNIYKWDFANTSETAQRVWDSLQNGVMGTWAHRGAFDPTVISGNFHGTTQDTWQYRVSEGVASFLLDDDTCDCKSTLNAGHAMCGGSGWNQTYAQPDGAYLRYGVDTLNDGGCLGPVPERKLELFYRVKG